jgi:hypothetical protein
MPQSLCLKSILNYFRILFFNKYILLMALKKLTVEQIQNIYFYLCFRRFSSSINNYILFQH